MERHIPIIFTDGGPWAEHDQTCAVCGDSKAILNLGDGVFIPCGSCQDKGWELKQHKGFAKWRYNRRRRW